jgi:hypothetical protein
VAVRYAGLVLGTSMKVTVPEFPCVVELLHYWCTEGREMFSTADRSPALWPSRSNPRHCVYTCDGEYRRCGWILHHPG